MITKEEIELLYGKAHGAYSNGGTLLYPITSPKENPITVLHFNGNNFIYKNEGDPRLTEIHIESWDLVKNEDPEVIAIKGKFDLIKKTLYLGHPQNIEELKDIINNILNKQ